MTDAEITTLIAKLNTTAVAIKPRFPGHVKFVQDAIIGLTELAALQKERTELLARIAVLEEEASGQLYHDIAYGIRDAWKTVGEMPEMVALQKAVDALPAEAA